MPVVTCPKCPTKLKIPDGVSGNTKCPKCGTIFPVGAPAPAFEVVDESPPPPPKPAAKPGAEEADFEVLDEAPKKRVVADEDDDFTSKKKKRDEDEDDDDDRPRSKKKKKRYDDDDDDDRPRRKKKKKRSRYDDDDDFEDWGPQPNRRAEFGKGKTGALLIAISFWLNLGTFALLSLYALIAWIGLIAATSSTARTAPRTSSGGSGGSSMESVLEVMIVLPGLIGAAAWIIGLVGSSIAIAGPAKARGMSITATVLAGVHLLLTGITFINLYDATGGFSVTRSMGMGSPAWMVLSSMLPVLDSFLPILFYGSSGITGDYMVALLAACCEVARLIFMLLTVKALAESAGDYEVGERAKFGVTISSFIIGGAVIAVLFIVIILAEGGVGLKTGLHIGMVTILLTLLAYTFMMFTPATAAMDAKHACDRRS